MAKTPSEKQSKITNVAAFEPRKEDAKGEKVGKPSALPPLPAMPRSRKAKPPKPCACGCGGMTRGGSFIPGHDGRVKGWALRIERGVVKLADVPDGEREAVKKFMLAKRKATSAAAKGDESKLNEETVADAVVEGEDTES